jgi:hypothetical protein
MELSPVAYNPSLTRHVTSRERSVTQFLQTARRDAPSDRLVAFREHLLIRPRGYDVAIHAGQQAAADAAGQPRACLGARLKLGRGRGHSCGTRGTGGLTAMPKTVKVVLIAVPIAALIAARYLDDERCVACGHDWYVHFSGSGGGCWTKSRPCFCTRDPPQRGSFPGLLTLRRFLSRTARSPDDGDEPSGYAGGES